MFTEIKGCLSLSQLITLKSSTFSQLFLFFPRINGFLIIKTNSFESRSTYSTAEVASFLTRKQKNLRRD